MGNIYKCKIDNKFYIIVEKHDNKFVRAIGIEDRKNYTLPIEDMELWIENAGHNECDRCGKTLCRGCQEYMDNKYEDDGK